MFVSELVKNCNEEDDLEAQVSMASNRTSSCKIVRHIEKQLATFQENLPRKIWEAMH